MAYNQVNQLRKIKRIQDIYMKHKEPGVTNRFIFNKYIQPYYDFTERTFYKYLNVKNPQKQIEKILAKKHQNKTH
jgi:hypothetical protein